MQITKNTKRSKYWCITVNEGAKTDEEQIKKLYVEGEVEALVIGREKGETGNVHLQVYCEFSRKRSFSYVRRRTPGCHVEPRLGSSQEAFEYCCKEGDFEIYGEFSCDTPNCQGRRTDLTRIRRELAEGKSELFIADNYFSQWCQYRRAFRQYRRLLANGGETRNNLRVFLLQGDPGTGKTRFVWEYARAKRLDCWASVDTKLQWFDGYIGQPIVLIDDFRGEADFSYLLRVLDIYPLQVPVKGDFEWLSPVLIFITSNRSIDGWYADQDLRPLRRRIHQTIEFSDRFINGMPRLDWEHDFELIKSSLAL